MPAAVPSGAVVGDALLAAVEELGLGLLGDGDGGPYRVYGPPGVFDPFLLTEIWIGEESAHIDCVVPVSVSRGRLDEVIELCLGLNTQGRVSFAVGDRGTPVVSHRLRLATGGNDLAFLFQAALEVTWKRAAAAEDLFRLIVDGADAESVLGTIDFDNDRELFEALPIHRVVGGVKGVEWKGVLEHSPPLPSDVEVPEGHTEPELRAAALAMHLSVESADPISEACAGPLLFHADGTVECFGCSQPDRVPHLAGSISACGNGKYLGVGHRCERCEAAA